MSSTFLDLTNKVIRRINDIPLTSATFADATGQQGMVKDAVIDSIRRINQDQYQWPFNHNSTSQTLAADTATYSLPSDYKVVDWETFFLQRDDTLGAPAKYLPDMDYDEWVVRRRAADESLDAGDGGIPDIVYRTRDDKFGVSTVPDAAYVIQYEYWSVPADLVLYSDATNIPSQWDHVIIEGALYHVYMFRSNEQAATLADQRFEEGLKQMRSILINREKYAWDTRSNNELNRTNKRFAAQRPI